MRLPTLSLFWRTFGLLLCLLILSFALWSQGFSLWQQYPRAQALAGQLITAVNVTRSALIYAQPTQREALLQSLNQDERVRVYLREPTDISTPLDDSRFLAWLKNTVYEGLGVDTELAHSVNGEVGLWVSFNIGGKQIGIDSYWLRFDARRLEPRVNNPTRWWLWMGLAVFIAFAGAAWISRRLAQPLGALAARAQSIAQSQAYAPLSEQGPKEIILVNRGMNQMVQALKAQDEERNFMLASLSHDIRTPLSRLRLELEMSQLPESTQAAMASDIAQIDMQLKQFTEYVASAKANLSLHAMDELVKQVLVSAGRDPSLRITESIAPVTWLCDPQLLRRALDNLIENAKRYGRSSDGLLYLSVALTLEPNDSVADSKTPYPCLRITDAGAGLNLDTQHRAHMLEPFTRGDAARSGAQGSGLGLAIVDRVMQKHGGRIELVSAYPSNGSQGLSVVLNFYA